MTTTAVDTLVDFFMGEGIFRGFGIDKMRETYGWKGYDYSTTVEIKTTSRRSFLAILQLSDAATETMVQEALRLVTDAQLSALLSMAEDVVSKWGGIKSNSTETLKRYVQQLNIEEARIPFSGIASRSKILPIAFPDRYIILDARVVVALTAVQLLEPPDMGQLFPYMESRNSSISRAKPRAFLARPDYRRNRILSRYPNWKKQTRSSAYFEYLKLMRMALVELTNTKPGVRLWDLEMALFWQATELVHALSEAETPALHHSK
ncbi:hypothetical protein [Pseudotabrizicola sp. 4114]|uniref:hypothetical protein n=1 Tax=Pseudotabrizicola sp. 4114 TaxID=2817731 RepID=UPI0028646B2F|nr:hypothetical protein [Pseudorhodobacter sp. 4114]